MTRSRSLIPLAALFALGVLMLSPWGRSDTADANVSSVVVSQASVVDGQTLNVTVNAQDDDGNIVVSVNDAGSHLSLVDCRVDGDVLSIGDDGCSDSDASSTKVQIASTANLDATTGDSDSAPESLVLNLKLTANCSHNVSHEIVITARQDGSQRSASIFCNAYPHSPAHVATVGPEQILLQVLPDKVGCSGTAIITATVRDHSGALVPNGTTVGFSTTRGEIYPTITKTAGGVAIITFTGPDWGTEPSRITATSGAQTVEKLIHINCQPTPTPTLQPSQPRTHQPIAPPSTGDGGLSGDQRNWRVPAGIALVAASLIGSMAVIRSRA